jgi:hypothetical protein
LEISGSWYHKIAVKKLKFKNMVKNEAVQTLLCIITAFKKKTFIVNIPDSQLWKLVAVGIIK